MKLGDMRLRLGGLGMRLRGLGIRPGGLKLRLGGLGMRLGGLGMRPRKESAISLHSPSFIMGSIVNVCPGFITPIALFSGRANQSTVTSPSLKKERRDVYFVCTYWHSVGHLAPGEITCTGEILLLDLL